MRWWVLGAFAALLWIPGARMNEWQGEDVGNAFGLTLVIGCGALAFAMKLAPKSDGLEQWGVAVLCGAFMLAFASFPAVQLAFAVLLGSVVLSNAWWHWCR